MFTVLAHSMTTKHTWHGHTYFIGSYDRLFGDITSLENRNHMDGLVSNKTYY